MISRILIAAGTAHYDHLPPDLQRPELTQAVESIAKLFTGQLGYTRVLQEISSDPTSDDLVQKLDRWFASTDRVQSDWVVFYYTGHGELDGDSLVLLTRNSEDDLVPSTGVSAEKLGQILMSRGKSGEKRRIRNCLLILDTCHSGAGAFDIIGKLRQFFDEDERGLFYVLAAALPREEALAGALARALIAAVQDESLGGTYQRLLYPEQLRAAINKLLKPHSFFYSSLGSSDEEPEFFPNPRYVPGLPTGATVAEVRRAVELGELQTFWGPTSRGVEMELQPGWYFTGRERVLRELSQWLRDPADDRTRVITGGPGSGKSAILAKIVTLSDPEYRRKMPQQDSLWSNAFPSESIDLAIHAKGKTLQEVTGRLATSLGVPADESEVLGALKSLGKSFNMVVDALDEAREPERIVNNLLAPLTSIPRVKLLVGTRPELRNKLGEGAVQIHIDEPNYFQKGDLAAYVTARLLRRGEKGASTPYQMKQALAEEVANAVAERAYPNFLIGRLVAEDLLASSQTLDRAAIQKRKFPATVANAFEHFLARFGADERRARDLLTPLAWAEGVGLPWGNIWPAAASGISRRSYGDNDIRWILDRAGSFVVETLEQDRSVYRLYHQALADYLRRGRDEKKIQRLIVKELTETVLQLENEDEGLLPRLWDFWRVTIPLAENRSSKSRDWRTAHPYIRSHLAEHAAACGMLTDLVFDPLFLLAADPDRLISVLDAHPDDVPPEIEHVYKGAFHSMKEKPMSEAAPYLGMSARKSQLDNLADQINQLPLNPLWTVDWANWLPVATHRILTDTTWVSALAVAEHGERTVILSGTGNGSIQIWDLEDGRLIGDPLIGHTGLIRALAVTKQRGHTVIISGSDDKSIRVWDLENGRSIGNLIGHTGWVRALAVTKLRGRTVIISGSDDDTIRKWDLDEARSVGDPITGHTHWVSALAISALQGRPVIISGSYDKSIRVWDLEEGHSLGTPLIGHTGWVNALLVVQRQGRPVIVSGSDDKSIRVWDFEEWRPLANSFGGRPAPISALAAATESAGRTVIISGGDDKNIRTWDLESLREFGNPLTGHTARVNALVVAEQKGRNLVISGSSDNSIRIWNTNSTRIWRPEVWRRHYSATWMNLSTRGKRPQWLMAPVSALAVVKLKPRSLGSSHATDLDGRLSEQPVFGSNPLPSFGDRPNVPHVPALGKEEMQTVIISGSDRKSIGLSDAKSGEELGGLPLDRVNRVRALAVVEREGQHLLVSGSNDNQVRVWNLDTKTELAGAPGQHTAEVNVVIVAEEVGRKLAISGSEDRTIRIWDLESACTDPNCNTQSGTFTRNPLDYVPSMLVRLGTPSIAMLNPAAEPLVAHTGGVNTLALLQRQGRNVILSGGTDHTIRIWDLEKGSVLGDPLTGHSGSVNALAVFQREGRSVILSGSSDNSIRLWDLERRNVLDRHLTGHNGGVNALAVCEVEGRQVIISGSSDNSVRLWDLELLELLQTIYVGAPVRALALVGDATVVVGTSMGMMLLRLRRL